MPNTIRIKRRPSSGAAGKPASLYNGELAFNENDNILYYGYGSGVGGVANSIEQIGGTGYFATRGGTNASGVWPIDVTGNSATVTDGVYTTGNQNIGGIKRFTSQVELSGNLGQNLIFKSANASNYGNIIFDGVNYDSALQSSYITSTTGNMEIAHGQKIQLNSAIEVKAASTSGNSVGYFAVFDSNPASSLTTLKSVSKDQILDDIGAATSGLNITAGSGLVGGGTLSTDRRFDVGQGDGISVSADSIAVDSTVVRTTGTQSIGGTKTFTSQSFFNDYANFGSGINVSAGINYLNGITQIQASSTSSTVTNIPVFINNPSAGTQTIFTRTPSEIKSDIGLSNVQNLALSDITFTAGSGLVGGGTLSQNRRFDIGQGDGITVSADSIAVDSTVVRTTGTQTINGLKTFGNLSTFNSGISVSNNGIKLKTDANGTITFYGEENSHTNSNIYFETDFAVSYVAYKEGGLNQFGYGNVTNDAQIKKLASTSGGYVPTWNGTTGDALNIGYSVETTLTGGTGALPRADAVKTYVDNMIVSGIATNDAMIFKGAIDCSTNPNYPAADRGWTYKVSVAGKIGGASGPTVEVNDTLICTTDGTSAGTHAVVGSNWIILQTNIADASILVTGPSSATSGNIAMFDGSTGKIIKDGGFAASNVVLTTGNQTISGEKTFTNKITANTGIVIGDTANYLTGTGLVMYYSDGGGYLASFVNGATVASNSIKLNSVTTFDRVLNDGPLPFVINPTGYAGSGAVTQGYWRGETIEVNKGGTGQTSYTNGQLLIGNTTGNTLTKATLTAGTSIDITNGNGSITIGHSDTSTLTGAQGSNGIASFTLDGLGHVTAVTTATYLTAGTVCAAIADCTLDGGSF